MILLTSFRKYTLGNIVKCTLKGYQSLRFMSFKYLLPRTFTLFRRRKKHLFFFYYSLDLFVGIFRGIRLTYQVCRRVKTNACRFSTPRYKGRRWWVRRSWRRPRVGMVASVVAARSYQWLPTASPRHHFRLLCNTVALPRRHRQTSPYRSRQYSRYSYSCLSCCSLPTPTKITKKNNISSCYNKSTKKNSIVKMSPLRPTLFLQDFYFLSF